MTRIGFAYNQKPELPALRLEDGAEDARPDEEPPSSSEPEWASAPAGGVAAASVDDEFAEWDSAETINGDWYSHGGFSKIHPGVTRNVEMSAALGAFSENGCVNIPA